MLLGKPWKNPSVKPRGLVVLTLYLPAPKGPHRHFFRVIRKWNLQITKRSWQHFILSHIVINWNIENKHDLAFPALFYVGDWRGEGYSALTKWAGNVSNPCISYNPLKRIVENHPLKKKILAKIKVVDNALLFGRSTERHSLIMVCAFLLALIKIFLKKWDHYRIW